MEFNNTEVFNFEGAIRGMRNPMNSWKKSDSFYCFEHNDVHDCIEKNCLFLDTHYNCVKAEEVKSKMDVLKHKSLYVIGENDLQLMQKLIKAGSEHRKFMRQIFISVDITAPLYWWKEFDTYKVGTVGNSTSTMHKIASKEITIDDFEMGDFAEDLSSWYQSHYESDTMRSHWCALICVLEDLRVSYNETKDKRYWKELIRLLPESYIQTRTVTMNYENALTMIKQRRNHKLKEWSVDFIGWTKKLPYADELLYLEDKE